ncbi:MAG: hypothetical protein VXY23_16680 [Pseudomonadota bacterium]|nr:hypothetical protein [Pseudomonadota bacterium]
MGQSLIVSKFGFWVILATLWGHSIYASAESAGAPSVDPALFDQEPTPLIGLTAIDDPMNDYEEPNASARGGMEMQRYFSTTVVGKLQDCLAGIDKVLSEWTAANKLIPVEHIKTEHQLTLRIWDRTLTGIFEGGYRFDKGKSYVRASLDYFSLKGDQLPLAAIESMLGEYGMDQLTTNLQGALQCE